MTGKYDFELNVSDVQLNLNPDERVANPDVGLDTNSAFTALQEQLGLRLKGGKGPVKIFVVERVERPSEISTLTDQPFPTPRSSTLSRNGPAELTDRSNVASTALFFHANPNR